MWLPGDELTRVIPRSAGLGAPSAAPSRRLRVVAPPARTLAAAGSGVSGAPQRTLVLWCPDWPVLAAEIVDGVPATEPVAVLHANRVVACSERPAPKGCGAGCAAGRRRGAART